MNLIRKTTDMERNFTNENFEGFLQQNADGLRMRPSAKVWKGISDRLNQRRRRIGWILGISLLLTTGSAYYFITGSSKLSSPNTTASSKNNSTALPNGKNNTDLNLNSIVSVSKDRVNDQTSLLQDRSSSLFRVNLSNSTSIYTNSEPVNDLNTIVSNNIAQKYSNDFVGTVVDSYDETAMTGEESSSMKEVNAVDPLTIESVINHFQPGHKSKLGLQLYFTPTISYRKLSDNNIDNVTSHKPDFGFEVGLAGKYPLSKSLKLRGGIQFNVNRYDIKTYSTSTQTATIRVNDHNGVGYLNQPTNYNNFGGYKSDWLKNFYFQVSAPIGLELKVKGDNHTQFGIASTIQPTYVLGDRAYLISSDYKNYAEVPKLIRHWNVSTSFETYVGYSTGHVKWQVGPQIRYQLLSSYLKKYPVKENLFDFGLKVGVSLNNR